MKSVLDKKEEETQRILKAIEEYNKGKHSTETLRQIIKISLTEMFVYGVHIKDYEK